MEARALEKKQIKKKMEGIQFSNYYKTLEATPEETPDSFAKKIQDQARNMDKQIQKENAAQLRQQK